MLLHRPRIERVRRSAHGAHFQIINFLIAP
jgi:hypothetical protein